MKPVGILGGMGPEATILMMQRVLEAVPARDDADHIPLIVHQNPQVPSRIARLIEGRGAHPGPVLADMARALQGAGAQAIAMPCNTAHAYADQIMAACDLPFLDMRVATAQHLAGVSPGPRIGLLASPAVRLSGAFDRVFQAGGFVQIWPEDEAGVLSLIRQVKSGERGEKQRSSLAQETARLARSCDHVLIACTELSVISDDIDMPFTDSMDCLVRRVVAFATA